MVTIAILLVKTSPVQSIVSTLTDAWLHNKLRTKTINKIVTYNYVIGYTPLHNFSILIIHCCVTKSFSAVVMSVASTMFTLCKLQPHVVCTGFTKPYVVFPLPVGPMIAFNPGSIRPLQGTEETCWLHVVLLAYRPHIKLDYCDHPISSRVHKLKLTY